MLQTKVESCTELNFIQKTHWKRIFVYHKSRATGLKDLLLLKYY